MIDGGKKRRIVYLDFLRIIAAFLVIFNHTKGYLLYKEGMANTSNFISMVLAMITRINVPIFFMISGILLFSKDETISNILKKRVLRFLIIILFFSFFVYLFENNGNFKFLNFFTKLYSGEIANIYWFLYDYLGFLLLLPFIKKIVVNFKSSDYKYIIFLHFIVSTLLPIIAYIFYNFNHTSISSGLKLAMASERAIFYPIIGFYLSKLPLEKITPKYLIKLFILSILSITIECLLTYHQGVNFGYSQNFVMLFDYILAIFVFLLIRYLFEKKEIFKNRKNFLSELSYIGTLTFGMYLLYPFLNDLFYNNFFNLLSPYVGYIITSFAWCIFTMSLLGACTAILKDIPIIGKLF